MKIPFSYVGDSNVTASVAVTATVGVAVTATVTDAVTLLSAIQ